MTIARRITIREVARLADVSVGTVSNVLNGAAGVSPATRRRVEQVIADLGFAPDSVARSLTARRRRKPPDSGLTRRYVDLLAARGLPQPDQPSLDLLTQILDEGALGATRHVHLAHRLLIHMARQTPRDEGPWGAIRATGDFIAATRGADVPLVSNGVAWLMDALDPVPAADSGDKLAARAALWQEQSRARLDRLIDLASSLLGAGARPVLLDYSGTVAGIVERLGRRGLAPFPTVLENRGVAGGVRYVNQFLGAGIDLRLAPDSALEFVLAEADCVLIGCESLRCDGSAVNSLGSRPLARIAQALEIPVYCCAEMFKLDLRSYRGAFEVSGARRYDFPLIDEIDIPEGRRVDAVIPAVEVVPARFITAFLTEHGPTPPAAIFGLGRALFADRLAALGAGEPADD